MKKATTKLVMPAMIILTSLVVLASSYSQVTGTPGIAVITTPSLTTSTTFQPTVTTTVSTSVTTTSTSTSSSATSTSTSTTSTYTSWSYTSTYSSTTTDTTTFTSYTNTVISTQTSITTTVTSTTQTSVSTITTTTTTTVAVFPGCLIATATFGSELAPEVQLLRGFRDNSILKTAAGSGFMVAFNSWYYSFSPAVAGYLYTHPAERTIMKFVLYPLIGILKLSSLTFSAASTYPEFAALLSGLVASSLIGAFYLGLPLSLLRTKIIRLRGGRLSKLLEKALGVGLVSGIAALLIGEAVGSVSILMTSTATIVLSALFLSAAVTSSVISRKLQTQ